MEILWIFKDIESAAKGVDGLIAVGFVETQITSLTSVPYPDGVLVKSGRSSWFRWLALGGGIAGATVGIGLAAGTAWLYPVQTGDKPIIALYPTAIIAFEMAMLFAIIGTMVGMFLEMRLPPRRTRLYDPSIAAGAIGISVTIHGGGEAVACGAEEGADECIGMIAALPAAEQRERADAIMKKAGALRTITES